MFYKHVNILQTCHSEKIMLYKYVSPKHTKLFKYVRLKNTMLYKHVRLKNTMLYKHVKGEKYHVIQPCQK